MRPVTFPAEQPAQNPQAEPGSPDQSRRRAPPGAWNAGALTYEPVYTVETRENDQRIGLTEETDPFVHHTVYVRGWRNALGVLLRRHKITVVVGADRETIEAVNELNPDYLGAHGSERRRRWSKHLQEALRNVG